MMALTRFRSSLALCGLLTALSAQAEPVHYNQVSLKAEVSAEVPRDRMHVTLYTELQDKDPTRLSEEVTKLMNGALAQARQAEGVTVSLGNRNSYPVHDKEGLQINLWRERAELRLESTNFTSLARLTGELTQSLKMGGLYFSVSKKAQQEAEDALLKDAIAAFRNRALKATESLGGSGYKLVQLNLNSNGGYSPMPMMMRASLMKAERAPTPDIESGTQSITLTADGTIEVQQP